ncbi:bacteriocin-like WGxF protein [Paenibacillus caui]|uniref:bacteriocin-like WGxF protein n=1 Tax=Paenibacillus caui TaxID=2873927 RepID=UPI001CA85FE5
MIRSLLLSFVNCLLFIVAGVIHRIVLRRFQLPINNVAIYWGTFIGIFFIISLLFMLLFRSKR